MKRHIVSVAFLLVLLFVLLRTAWLSDDAYITLRTVDNFVHGLGLTWNVGERVQAYTHPLWMFLLSSVYLITGEPYYTTLLLSLAVSLLAVALYAFTLHDSSKQALPGLLVLIGSKSFVDFSTSGLETPLSNLILVLYSLSFLRSRFSSRGVGVLSLLAALGILNRTDLLVLFLPSLAYALAQNRKASGFFAALAGFFPLLVWEVFSLFYYGAPFPNTAYAKLNTGVPHLALVRQGLAYFQDSLALDPLTLVIIALGLATPLVRRKLRPFLLSVGVFLYLLYVLSIGGCFMSGRYFAVPVFCSAIVLSGCNLPLAGWRRGAVIAVVVALSLWSPYPNILSDASYGLDRGELVLSKTSFGLTARRRSDDALRAASGIVDERAFYFPWTGLLRRDQSIGVENFPPRVEMHYLKKAKMRVYVTGAIGIAGYYAGPKLHIIDVNGLADPLLSRLHCRKGWIIGHFTRDLPDGYLASIANGRNLIEDGELARYYDILVRVTRGKLLDWERMREVWHLNAGRYDHLLPQHRRASTIQSPQ